MKDQEYPTLNFDKGGAELFSRRGHRKDTIMKKMPNFNLQSGMKEEQSRYCEDVYDRIDILVGEYIDDEEIERQIQVKIYTYNVNEQYQVILIEDETLLGKVEYLTKLNSFLYKSFTDSLEQFRLPLAYTLLKLNSNKQKSPAKQIRENIPLKDETIYRNQADCFRTRVESYFKDAKSNHSQIDNGIKSKQQGHNINSEQLIDSSHTVNDLFDKIIEGTHKQASINNDSKLSILQDGDRILNDNGIKVSIDNVPKTKINDNHTKWEQRKLNNIFSRKLSDNNQDVLQKDYNTIDIIQNGASPSQISCMQSFLNSSPQVLYPSVCYSFNDQIILTPQVMEINSQRSNEHQMSITRHKENSCSTCGHHSSYEQLNNTKYYGFLTLNNIYNYMDYITLLQRKQLELKIKEVNIRKVVEDVINVLSCQGAKKNVEVLFLNDLKDEQMITDERRVKQVLFNLLMVMLQRTNRGQIGIRVKESHSKVKSLKFQLFSTSKKAYKSMKAAKLVLHSVKDIHKAKENKYLLEQSMSVQIIGRLGPYGKIDVSNINGTNVTFEMYSNMNILQSTVRSKKLISVDTDGFQNRQNLNKSMVSIYVPQKKREGEVSEDSVDSDIGYTLNKRTVSNQNRILQPHSVPFQDQAENMYIDSKYQLNLSNFDSLRQQQSNLGSGKNLTFIHENGIIFQDEKNGLINQDDKDNFINYFDMNKNILNQSNMNSCLDNIKLPNLQEHSKSLFSDRSSSTSQRNDCIVPNLIENKKMSSIHSQKYIKLLGEYKNINLNINCLQEIKNTPNNQDNKSVSSNQEENKNLSTFLDQDFNSHTSIELENEHQKNTIQKESINISIKNDNIADSLNNNCEKRPINDLTSQTQKSLSYYRQYSDSDRQLTSFKKLKMSISSRRSSFPSTINA